MEWNHTDSPVNKKFPALWSVKKFMITIIWDMKRLFPIVFLVKANIVNSTPNCRLLRQYLIFYLYIYIYIYIYFIKKIYIYIYIYIFYKIIIIIMSCHQHGYPWPSLATFPDRSSPPAGLLGYILCPHIAAVCKFGLVVLLLLGHMWGSIGVRHLRARPCFSSSVPRVWLVSPV